MTHVAPKALHDQYKADLEYTCTPKGMHGKLPVTNLVTEWERTEVTLLRFHNPKSAVT